MALRTHKQIQDYIDSHVSGVTSISKLTDPLLTGDVTLSEGANITLTQSGQDIQISGTAAGVTDHGALTGLSDDDHTQYLLVNGTRAMTGDLDMDGNTLSNLEMLEIIDNTATSNDGLYMELGSTGNCISDGNAMFYGEAYVDGAGGHGFWNYLISEGLGATGDMYGFWSELDPDASDHADATMAAFRGHLSATSGSAEKVGVQLLGEWDYSLIGDGHDVTIRAFSAGRNPSASAEHVIIDGSNTTTPGQVKLATNFGSVLTGEVDVDGNNIENADEINFLGNGSTSQGRISFDGGTKYIDVISSPVDTIGFYNFGTAGFGDTVFAAVTLDPSDIDYPFLFNVHLGTAGTPITTADSNTAEIKSTVGAVPVGSHAGTSTFYANSDGLTNANSYFYGVKSRIVGDSSDIATTSAYGFLALFVEAATDNIKSVAYGLNSTDAFDYSLADEVNDLKIATFGSDKDIIFEVNDGGTSYDMLQLDASVGKLILNPSTGASYSTGGLFNITGNFTGSGIAAAMSFNPVITGGSYFVPFLAQPTMNTSATTIAFFMNPSYGATYNQSIEMFRQVNPPHKVGYNDAYKFMTVGNETRGFFGSAAWNPHDPSTVAYSWLGMGGALSLGDFGGSTALPTITETMIKLTGGASKIGTLGSINQTGLEFSGFGTQTGLIAGTDSCTALLANGGDFKLQADNCKWFFGGGDDAEIYFDGTDFVIDSDAPASTALVKFASSSNWTANATNTVTISNVAPAGVGTATISQWFTVKDSAGTTYYIPAWT